MAHLEPERNRPVTRILIGALPLQFAFGLIYAWGALAPYIQRDLHWPGLLISAVFSATPVGYGTGILVGGRLADRVPPRRLCWTGLALMAAGLSIALSVPTGITFVFFYAMLGLGLGGGLALAGSIAACRHALPGRDGTSGGLVTGAYAIAAPIQVPVISLLAGTFGWLTTLRGAGAVMIAVGGLTLAAMPAVNAPTAAAHRTGVGPSARHLLMRPRIISAILLELTSTPLGAYAFVNTASYARGLLFTTAVATAAITGVAVGNATGRIAAGALSDRVGVDRVMLGMLVLGGAAALTLYLHPGEVAVVAAAAIAGLGFGAPAGVVSRLAQDAAPDAPNAAFGLIFAGFAAGAGGGSLLGAAVGGGAAWLMLGGLALSGLLVVGARLRFHGRVGTLG